MRILHVFRTPVGGLFRHVRDLARGQQDRGHVVGMLCDSTTGGDGAARLLESARDYCDLGIERIPISRLPGLGDISGVKLTSRHAQKVSPHIIHCHGAKGGVYGRLAASRIGLPSVYTPHGGSMHYNWSSPAGAVFLGAETALARLGGALCFVCDYERAVFDRKIGLKKAVHAVVHNGLWAEEFTRIPVNDDAADLVFIGEMRKLKGVDVLLEALTLCAQKRRVTACLVGDGPDLETFRTMAREAALDGLVTFAGRLPASEAFKRGRIFVMPSRAESFPYVVLEAAAASRPIIATAVGGVAEALPQSQLVPPEDATKLAARILDMLAQPERTEAEADAVSRSISKTFTAGRMVDGVLGLYKRAGAF